MSIESSIENRIREAIERGDFDNLPGKGKPLDLDAYFNTPEDMRMAFAMLKSNDFVPEEVEILREIDALRTKINESSDDVEMRASKRELNERSLALTLRLESRRRK